MEVRRRHEKNKLLSEISDIKNYNKVDISTLGRLRSSGVNVEFNKKQIDKIYKAIEEREEKLERLKERLQKLPTGELDAELEKQSNDIHSEIQRKVDEKKKHKAEIAASKQEDRKKSQAYYQADRAITRKDRRNNKDINWGYNFFKRNCSSVPDYMRKKLADMPENKGYIWKSVYCYGERPAEKGRPVSMFERPRGGDKLLIHEWTPNVYKLYEKIGKGPKTLVMTQKRKPKHTGSTLADFI